MIRNYCEANDIETSMATEMFNAPASKRRKGDTKKTSLDLFLEGNSIKTIAEKRELNANTIFGHLASFVSTGEVKITDLISKDHYETLKTLIPKQKFENLSDLKHQLEDEYSYGELRLVLEELKK